MKYKFKGSEIKNIITEEVMRYYSLKENFSTGTTPTTSTSPSTQNPMKFNVVVQGKGITGPSSEIKSSNIEDAVESAKHWTQKGYSLDNKLTSKEVLQQLNMAPTMPDQPGPPEAPVPQKDHSLSGIMEDNDVVQSSQEPGSTARPKRQEFIKQTYELIKQQMPDLSFEDL